MKKAKTAGGIICVLLAVLVLTACTGSEGEAIRGATGESLRVSAGESLRVSAGESLRVSAGESLRYSGLSRSGRSTSSVTSEVSLPTAPSGTYAADLRSFLSEYSEPGMTIRADAEVRFSGSRFTFTISASVRWDDFPSWNDSISESISGTFEMDGNAIYLYADDDDYNYYGGYLTAFFNPSADSISLYIDDFGDMFTFTKR